jgi:nucleotide-binding universal stress UspA family protein
MAEREEALATSWTAPAAEKGATVRSVVRSGDPRDVIPGVAEHESSDLLVLGRSGSGGSPGFLHLGSVVEHAAHHVSLPLAVVPGGWDRPVEQIVIGIDGSVPSSRAVEWVAGIAPSLGASVTAVHVEESSSRLRSTEESESWRIGARRDLEQWTEPISRAGVEVEHVLQQDIHPADGLLGVAAARQGDLLVTGMRGLGGFAALRAGGVALKVLHRAELPLVLIPTS